MANSDAAVEISESRLEKVVTRKNISKVLGSQIDVNKATHRKGSKEELSGSNATFECEARDSDLSELACPKGT